MSAAASQSGLCIVAAALAPLYCGARRMGLGTRWKDLGGADFIASDAKELSESPSRPKLMGSNYPRPDAQQAGPRVIAELGDQLRNFASE